MAAKISAWTVPTVATCTIRPLRHVQYDPCNMYNTTVATCTMSFSVTWHCTCTVGVVNGCKTAARQTSRSVIFVLLSCGICLCCPWAVLHPLLAWILVNFATLSNIAQNVWSLSLHKTTCRNFVQVDCLSRMEANRWLRRKSGFG